MSTSVVNVHCLDCHEFSSRDFFPDSGDCINCHDFARNHIGIVENEHLSIEVETYCLSCHDPHSENMYEDCMTCHNIEDSGLHEVSSHYSCENCHSPHRSSSLREVCISCHLDKEEHYRFTRCEMCHSFIS